MQQKILQGRVAIITGGGRGIGKEIARVFARAGCAVALAARTARELARAAEDITKETGTTVETFAVDVSRESAVRRMVSRVAKKSGRIDIAVNAAGIIKPIGPLEECDSKEWENVLHVNLLGTFFVMKAVLPHMKKAASGVIMNFSGGGALNPFPNFSAYSASKAAVVRLTETVAEEVKAFNIRVNAISPGAVNTRILQDMLDEGSRMSQAQQEEFERRKKKGGDSVEKACGLALFLASEASRGITGKVISAQWDPWEKLSEHVDDLAASDIYTMRRIKPEDRGKHWK